MTEKPMSTFIRSFNGIQLDSAAAGAKVLSQFVDADSFEIELANGDITTVGPDELAELLGDRGAE